MVFSIAMTHQMVITGKQYGTHGLNQNHKLYYSFRQGRIGHFQPTGKFSFGPHAPPPPIIPLFTI